MSKTVCPPAWPLFPHSHTKYLYRAGALQKHWARLHLGDREPWPAGAAVQEAWRLYHAGQFQQAHDAGLAAGLEGYNAANKAAMIHANYLETDAAARLERFQAVAERCAELQKARPDDVNAHYLQGYALGRYSQGISVVKALAQGLGGRIQAALETALRLDEQHADAHCALGAFQAEVVDKVGALVGRLSHGASKDSAAAHFKCALAQVPHSAIFAVEQANALLLMHGQGRRAQALQLYLQAAACEPLDAMEHLDVDLARAKVRAAQAG